MKKNAASFIAYLTFFISWSLAYQVLFVLAFFHYMPLNITIILFVIYTVITFYRIKNKDEIHYSFFPIMMYFIMFFMYCAGNKFPLNDYSMVILHSTIWIILASAIRGNEFSSYREHASIPLRPQKYPTFLSTNTPKLLQIDTRLLSNLTIDNQSIIDAMDAYPEFRDIVFFSTERYAYRREVNRLKKNKGTSEEIIANAHLELHDSIYLKKCMEQYIELIGKEMNDYNNIKQHQ